MKKLTIVWRWEDITSRDETLSYEDACNILALIDDALDCNVGVTWDVIDRTIEDYKREVKMNINDFDDIQHLHELLPKKCVLECTASGDNHEVCKKWVEKLSLNAPRQKCLPLCKENCLSEEAIDEMDDLELNIRVLWLAAWHEE